VGSHFGHHFGRHFGWHFGGGVPAVGPSADLATQLEIEDGASVTYSWRTTIIKSSDGTEQRISRRAKPRQRYDFTARLSDAQQRLVQQRLARDAHRGIEMLLGLSYEELPIAEGSSGTSVAVYSLAHCDWDEPGQRAIIIHPDGNSLDVIVQSSSGTTIVVDVDASAFAVEGARIMPAMSVLLEPDQAMSRWRVNTGEWEIAAHSRQFRFGTAGVVGTGATLTTHDGMPVWDWGVLSKGQRAEGIRSGTEILDGGGAIGSLARYAQSDWPRNVSIESDEIEDWQWFKLFLDTVNGMRVAWLLPTGRPDLVPVGDASSGTLTINAGYLDSLWPSMAHRRVKIVLASGTIAYRTISNAVDNLDGTEDLTLNAAVAGTIARVELLETVRLDTDDIKVAWTSWEFSSSFPVMAVQQ
jgi:hypothetical protein